MSEKEVREFINDLITIFSHFLHKEINQCIICDTYDDEYNTMLKRYVHKDLGEFYICNTCESEFLADQQSFIEKIKQKQKQNNI